MVAAAVATTVLLVVAAPAHGQSAAPLGRRADVRVVITGPDRAEVVEAFEMEAAAAPREFRFLASPCASIDSVRVTTGGQSAVVPAAGSGPWVVLPPARALSAALVEVSYSARLAGPAPSIPLVMPALSFGAASAAGTQAPVHLRLTTGDVGDAHPIFPTMRRTNAAHEWETQLVGVPSLVRVGMPSAAAAPCAGKLVSAGAEPFFRVFFTFVAVIALWVPLYLLWANRSRDVTETRRREPA